MRTNPRNKLMLLLALALAASLPASASDAGDALRWTASWGAAVVAGAPKVGQPVPAADTTYRQIVRLSAGGSRLRVRLSNVHGEAPLAIAAATIAGGSVGSDAIDVKTLRALRFNGALVVTVAPGAEAVSDEFDFDARSGQDLALSLHAAAQPARQSMHVAAHATQFSAPGDQTGAPAMPGAQRLTSWHYVTGVEVLGARMPLLVGVGDSLTDGSGSGKDANARWTDWLQRRIVRDQLPAMAVVNGGIGGNQMLRDGTGEKLLDRFERDVLQRPGVTDAVVLIGINDLGRQHKGGRDTPPARAQLLADLQDGWRKLVAQAHARGVCVAAVTLPPYGTSTLYRPEAHNEEDRHKLNQWLRTSGVFDAVADADAALRDPASANQAAPARLLARYDSGDGLHLSSDGYRALADSVPLDALAACRARVADTVPYARAPALALAERAANYQLAVMAGGDAPPNAARETLNKFDWIQGTFFVGLRDLAERSANPAYRQTILSRGVANQFRLGPRIYHADDHVIGQAYLWAARHGTGDAALVPMRQQFDRILAFQPTVGLEHRNYNDPRGVDCDQRWCWADALFMAPPVWLELARLTGDNRYADYAKREFQATSAYLFDPREHLYYRDSRFFDRRGPAGEKIFWSRGSGWVFAGLARAIPLLDEGDPVRTEMATRFRQMAARLITVQKPDGYWPPSLLADPAGSRPESSGTAFFTYGLAWGIKAGLLERGAYEPALRKGWAALARSVHADGKVGWVQPVGDRPNDVSFDDTQFFGVGAFLLAATAVSDLNLP